MNRLACMAFIGALALLSVTPGDALGRKPATVDTQRTPDGWVLRVNGKPFYVKGISCNDAIVDGVDYLQMAKDAGANAVRIYGEATEEYLNVAERHGLMVNVGFWTNAIRLGTKESYRDPKHTAALKASALAYVRRFKDHPAVLTWTLGNETFIFSEPEAEREAYGRFLEDLVRAVHQEDPRHPIIYSSSHVRCLPYLKRWVPSIDIVGINATGGVGPATEWPLKNGFDRPVLVTEFAPLGAWEMRKDPNGMPYDPFDHLKADTYLSSWRQIQSNRRSVIGAFAFVLGGFRNQDSLTWYNMNFHGLKRAGYWAIHELYTGRKPHNRPPKISAFNASPASDLLPAAEITASVQVQDPEEDRLEYEFFITGIADDPLMVEKPKYVNTEVTDNRGGFARLRAPSEEGIFRVYAAVRDGKGNIAVANRTIRVGPAPASR